MRCIVVEVEVTILVRTSYYDTRFPSGTCLGKWRKNKLKKSAQYLTEEASNVTVHIKHART